VIYLPYLKNTDVADQISNVPQRKKATRRVQSCGYSLIFLL